MSDDLGLTIPPSIPERLNLADWFLDARVREGRGARVALRTDAGTTTYAEVQECANRYGNLLLELGVRPEERVIVALPDGVQWVGAFFGALKIGAAVVMVNPYLRAESVRYFYEYTRVRAAIVDAEQLPAFAAACGLDASTGTAAPRSSAESAGSAGGSEPGGGVLDVAPGVGHLRSLLVAGTGALEARLTACAAELDTYPSHRDDAAIWLFSGGTTGKPKAVVQSHASFVNTAVCYGQGVLGLTEDDATISVPKLFFGYATGSNLLFPFSVGGSTVLFPDRCTAQVLFEKIERHRPTVMINVPTMINQMVSDEDAASRDLSSLRLCTSAGEALPVDLHERWDRAFGVELLDGLGTAEQWHVFISNRPGDVTPGTIGKVVPGFEVRVRDEEGRDLPDGEIGYLWVKGNSRAQGYWQRMERTMQAFRGEWYVSGDMVCRHTDGTFTYCGRGDDMLKVSGKWLSPGEVENCLVGHPDVKEAAVVGVEVDGLTVPRAYVVPASEDADLDDLVVALLGHVREHLESYKCPRELIVLPDFPRTHLGKVDRGALKQQ